MTLNITKRIFGLSCLLILLSFYGKAQVSLQNLLLENQTNPIGLDTRDPRFSWSLQTDKRNVKQTAYEILVSTAANGKTPVWQTGKVNSDQSVHILYAGKSLESGKRYFWKVRVWDNQGNVSAWSEPAFWQMALLNKSDWKAQWIEAGFKEDTIKRPAHLLRKAFSAAKKITSATAYITAHGMYEAHINGQRVGDAYLTPGWTSYNKRLQYQVYDVTNLLKTGKNAIGVTLGNGWYRSTIGFVGRSNYYGKKLGLLLQLDITYSDGSKESIVSDGTWKASTGPILSSEIYFGEVYDARAFKSDWATGSFNDQQWSGVEVKDYAKDVLIATYNEPVRKHEVFKPVKIFSTPKGEKVIDFGQNLVGWVVLKANGKAGDKIVLSHAEVLDKFGNFYTDNLRTADSRNTYILSGGKQETFEPHFTWQGFRYLKVEGIDGDLNPDNFTAVTLYSDMKPTGTFTSSNALINQLQKNIQWGQKGNFLDVPTDCPQRDERLGWTGDAQAFSRTAAFNFGANSFFAKWLKDVAADQLPNGAVPAVIPNILGPFAGGSGWSDVATIAPWNMYLAYGDKRILEDQYPSMKAWVNYIKEQSKNDLWNSGHHFGDWLFYRPGDDNDGRSAVTDKFLIAQCFYAFSTELLIKTAKVLNKPEDVAQYSDLLKKIKEAFLKEYLTPNGRLVSSSQTAYVLALNFDMLPEGMREQAVQRLVENVKSYGNHLTTGFLGTPYLCHVLTRFGRTDIAYKLLLQETYPSWLYPVKMGATTIWERWDGIKPDSTFQNVGMNSFNHYAYGAIGDWMYRVMAGIDTKESGVGYKEIVIKPHLGGNFSNAAADLQTYYGTVVSHWKVENKQLQFETTIPPNTSATIYIPASGVEDVKENGKSLAEVADIKVVGKEGDYVVVNVGSGKYQFSSNVNQLFKEVKLGDYAGKYVTASAQTREIEVSVRNNELVIKGGMVSGTASPIEGKPDVFENGDAKIKFIRDGQGKVSKINIEVMSFLIEGTKE
ncbi:alpha-L-rhamnosidase [Pseudarcicella hirudinis]|uniref:alpha-L-rhamnosidase n=2 Tax=Pseudarcicella hirudinis TaxID=1079859 RepID=A0A1I5PBG3_9BACT|nr:alpha-L-rhamnosidase [Pseudarcicella hirudinis]SFP30861.1 alpha-L-rhamnosidase [Pseudarcicella hirudinis]